MPTLTCGTCGARARWWIDAPALSRLPQLRCDFHRIARAHALPRVGPKMYAAMRYVALTPGANKYRVGTSIGPHGSNHFGWSIIQRSLHAGLLVNEGPENAAHLHLAPLGLVMMMVALVAIPVACPCGRDAVTHFRARLVDPVEGAS